MDPISTQKILEFIVLTTLRRRVGKASDSIFIFLEGKSDADEQLKEIQSKLENIETVLKRMENKIDTTLLLPLESGWLNLKDAQNLSSPILRNSSLSKAFSDFNKVIALPNSNFIGDVDNNIVRALAYFGKACVLDVLGEKEELISENIVKGFLVDYETAKTFLEEETWKEMVKKCYGGKVLISFKVGTSSSLKRSKNFSYRSSISVVVIRNEIVEGLKKEKRIEESFLISNCGNKRKTIVLDSGRYEVRVKLNIKDYYTWAYREDPPNMDDLEQTEYEEKIIHERFFLPLGTHNHLDIWADLKESGPWYNLLQEPLINIKMDKQVPIKHDSKEYEELIKSHT